MLSLANTPLEHPNWGRILWSLPCDCTQIQSNRNWLSPHPYQLHFPPRFDWLPPTWRVPSTVVHRRIFVFVPLHDDTILPYPTLAVLLSLELNMPTAFLPSDFYVLLRYVDVVAVVDLRLVLLIVFVSAQFLPVSVQHLKCSVWNDPVRPNVHLWFLQCAYPSPTLYSIWHVLDYLHHHLMRSHLSSTVFQHVVEEIHRPFQ